MKRRGRRDPQPSRRIHRRTARHPIEVDSTKLSEFIKDENFEKRDAITLEGELYLGIAAPAPGGAVSVEVTRTGFEENLTFELGDDSSDEGYGSILTYDGAVYYVNELPFGTVQGTNLGEATAYHRPAGAEPGPRRRRPGHPRPGGDYAHAVCFV